jgi:hypothetical protein
MNARRRVNSAVRRLIERATRDFVDPWNLLVILPCFLTPEPVSIFKEGVEK